MIMNRLADGIDMVIHGYVFIECDAENCYIVSQRDLRTGSLAIL